MALPLAERVDLAQALWQSIDDGLRAGEEWEAIQHAARRDAELASGATRGRSHEEVMREARRASCRRSIIRQRFDGHSHDADSSTSSPGFLPADPD